MRCSQSTHGTSLIYRSISSKRLVNSLNSLSALSKVSSGISVDLAVDHDTTIRCATSGFQPSGNSTLSRQAARLIWSTRLPRLRSSWFKLTVLPTNSLSAARIVSSPMISSISHSSWSNTSPNINTAFSLPAYNSFIRESCRALPASSPSSKITGRTFCPRNNDAI